MLAVVSLRITTLMISFTEQYQIIIFFAFAFAFVLSRAFPSFRGDWETTKLCIKIKEAPKEWNLRQFFFLLLLSKRSDVSRNVLLLTLMCAVYRKNIHSIFVRWMG